MGNHPGGGHVHTVKSSYVSETSTSSTSGDFTANSESGRDGRGRVPPLVHRHTSIPSSSVSRSPDRQKIRRASDGAQNLQQNRVGPIHLSPMAKVDEEFDAKVSKKVPASPSLQRLNRVLEQVFSGGTGPPPTSAGKNSITAPTSTALTADANANKTTASSATTIPAPSSKHHQQLVDQETRNLMAGNPGIPVHISADRRNSVEIARDALKDMFVKSPKVPKKFFKGANMDFIPGRRSRRQSEADQEPINFGKTPAVPPEIVYDPNVDIENDLDLQPRPRLRGHTIGNGQAMTAHKRSQAIAEAAQAARRRKENKKNIPTVFRYPGVKLPKGDATQVYICGTMTQWKCVEMTKPKGEHDFLRIIDCPEGKVVFKFNIDGVWMTDEKQSTIGSRDGRTWNVIYVKRADNDVFEALACDSFALRDTRHENGELNDSDRSSTNKWGQDKPSTIMVQKHKGPPLLPPHLLQVLLNKDTGQFNDPVLLPEPSHVTLDHLYAQSIRDNMLVLSTTNRYRKKCVTVLLYRPI